MIVSVFLAIKWDHITYLELKKIMKFDTKIWKKVAGAMIGRLWSLVMIPGSLKMSRMKAYQKSKFYDFRPKFSALFSELKGNDYSKFTTDFWKGINVHMEGVFFPTPPFSFTRTQVVKATMFSPYRNSAQVESLSFLEARLSQERLKSLLREDYVGDPTLVNYKYLASTVTISHLSHFVRFVDLTGCDLNEIETIVDWGGGYGSMARIFDRLTLKPYTYIIVDTPLLTCVQWLYLSTILGEERIHILRTSDDFIKKGKINLVPLCFLEHVHFSCDLFISTWALSESSAVAQDYVESQNWFNAKHLLLAFQSANQQFPAATRLGSLAQSRGAKLMEVPSFPGNFYAMR